MGNQSIKEVIARRIAQELKDGDVVNLGIGLPTLVADYIDENVNITLQSENGFIGMGVAPASGEEDPDIVNAGGQFTTVKQGAAFFDSAVSFGIIRGGHVDVTVLGALEVDEMGNLANYLIPGKMVPGMGGAMDLVTGAKKVIIATTHTAKGGAAKILKKCLLPLTAKGQVDLIVTELAVIEVTANGLLLKEVMPGVSLEDVLKNTEADLIISDQLRLHV